MKKIFLALVLSLVSLHAAAHGNSFAMTAEAIAAAGEDFEKTHASSLSLFTGVKGWPSANVILVKVYLSNNATVNYSCSMMAMSGNDTMMCTIQP